MSTAAAVLAIWIALGALATRLFRFTDEDDQ